MQRRVQKKRKRKNVHVPAYECEERHRILPRVFCPRGYFVLEEKAGQGARQAQTVLVEQRKRIAFTGVLSVDSFSEKQIALTLEGCGAVIGGEGLKVVDFSKTSGTFTAEGRVDGVRFTHGRGKPLVRLFK